jgi:hypothetical protein
MKRWSFAIIAIVFSGMLVFAQQPAPSHKSIFSSDLVLWSYMQEPQQPEPSAPRQQPTPDPQPDTHPAQNPTPVPPAPPEQSNPPAAAGTQAPTAQSFTGTISKESDNFVLKVSPTTSYKLDNQQEVQQYEGQRVRVTGTLESEINLIHVDKIEPMS